MKYITIILAMMFFPMLSADGHLKSEQEVLASVQKYFESRNNVD